MRQSIRVLGWTITIVTVLVFAFLVTSVYSLMQMVLVNQGIRPSDLRYEASNGTFVLSLGLSVNNTSYFDVSELTVITVLKDSEGVVISDGTTRAGRIPSGDESTIRHNLTVSIDDVLDKNLTHLLFRDGSLRLDSSVGLRYANLLGFQITLANMSIPWGAPFSNLSVGEPSNPRPVTGTAYLVDVPLSFENHSPFDIEGSMLVEAFNQNGVLLGSGDDGISVPHQSAYSGKIQVEISLGSFVNYTGSGYLEILFETSMFRSGVVKVPYG